LETGVVFVAIRPVDTGLAGVSDAQPASNNTALNNTALNSALITNNSFFI
jgi:hypothetical protein